MLLTLVAFVVALGLLIAAHEYGHYRVAVACGVKVLRFSVGFGKPLLRWQPKGCGRHWASAVSSGRATAVGCPRPTRACACARAMRSSWPG